MEKNLKLNLINIIKISNKLENSKTNLFIYNLGNSAPSYNTCIIIILSLYLLEIQLNITLNK